MPEGTEILAARGGMIVEVMQSNTISCPREECKQYNNYITIMHSDGSYARYMHIKYNGSRVAPGDFVKTGTVIAHSGNVGWSDGPHLHFVCFLGAFEKWRSLETRFRTGDGERNEILLAGRVYRRGY
jgi:murein DD-endopeptidase MepM/ murein hydrolase activator NlpD